MPAPESRGLNLGRKPGLHSRHSSNLLRPPFLPAGFLRWFCFRFRFFRFTLFRGLLGLLLRLLLLGCLWHVKRLL